MPLPIPVQAPVMRFPTDYQEYCLLPSGEYAFFREVCFFECFLREVLFRMGLSVAVLSIR